MKPSKNCHRCGLVVVSDRCLCGWPAKPDRRETGDGVQDTRQRPVLWTPRPAVRSDPEKVREAVGRMRALLGVAKPKGRR